MFSGFRVKDLGFRQTPAKILRLAQALPNVWPAKHRPQYFHVPLLFLAVSFISNMFTNTSTRASTSIAVSLAVFVPMTFCISTTYSH